MTPRQAQLLVARADGLTAKEAAADMGITLRTAKAMYERVAARHGAHSTIDLFRRLGWLRVPDDMRALASGSRRVPSSPRRPGALT